MVLSPYGKALAGILLITFLATPLLLLVALWPDQLPKAGELASYQFHLFHVELLPTGAKYTGPTIHLQSVYFFLAILSGFMGSMIHLSASFTDFVGAEKLKASWLLWYFVKPFTAAALALVFYFVLQAGLLNGNGNGVASPFGIVVLAALVGLFTDKATLKLEELFAVMFKPKDDRPDKLQRQSKPVTISAITPEKLSLKKENKIQIAGAGFDASPVTIQMNGQPIHDAQITPQKISFLFKPEPEAESATLLLTDQDGKELKKKEFAFEKLEVSHPGPVLNDKSHA